MYDTPHISLTHDQADEVVVQHLKGYLGLCMNDLQRLRGKVQWEYFEYEDFVNNLRSANAAIVVLQDHTVGEDFSHVQQTLNDYMDYLLDLV